MKNRVSKLVITMLITSFVIPEIAGAKVRGRRRSAGSGADRLLSVGLTTALSVKGNNAGNVAVDPNNKDVVITKEEYDLPENKMKFLNSLKINVSQAKDKALKQCEGISGAVSKIFALSTTSAVASGLGTAMAGTALATGIMKKNKQNVAGAIQEHGVTSEKEKLAMEKLTKEQKQLLEDHKSHILGLEKEEKKFYNEGNTLTQNEGETDEDFLKRKEESWGKARWYGEKIAEAKKLLADDREKMGLSREEDSSAVNLNQDVIDKNLRTATTLGHVRTGMMAGASATSLISLGTSAAASVDAGKLSEKMSACNKAIDELKIANSKLNAEIRDTEYLLKEKLGDQYDAKKPEYVKQAENMKANVDSIVGSCKKFETKDITYVKNLMTASSVVSGIGTATALTGAITSGLANTKKAKGNRKYEKNMDITANVMAGITAGTSLTSTGLSSAASVATGKKLQQQAKDCETALNNDTLIDVSKEVDAIGKRQEEQEKERNEKIDKIR